MEIIPQALFEGSLPVMVGLFVFWLLLRLIIGSFRNGFRKINL